MVIALLFADAPQVLPGTPLLLREGRPAHEEPSAPLLLFPEYHMVT